VFMVLLVTVLPILFGINLSLVTSGEETRLKAELTPEQMNNMNALIGINVTAPEPRTSVEVFSDLVEIENHATQQQSPLFWIFNRATLSWMGNSCWCKTLPIVGSVSEDLATYLASMYTAYVHSYHSTAKKHNLHRFSQLSVELTDWNVRVMSHVIQASPKPVWIGLISAGLPYFTTPSQFAKSNISKNLIGIGNNETCLEGFRVEDISCLTSKKCYDRVLTTRCGCSANDVHLMFEVREIVITEALKMRHKGYLNTVFVPVCGSTTDEGPHFEPYETVEEVEAVMNLANYGRPRNSSGEDSHEQLCGAIVINDGSDDGLRATIRLDSTWLSSSGAQFYLWITKEQHTPSRMGMHANYSKPHSAKSWYMRQGFLALQLLVGRFFEHRHVGDLKNLTESDYVLEWTELDRYRFVPFPSAPHPSSPGLESLVNLYDLSYWAFAFVVAVQAEEIVRERERRHFMRISGGLEDWAYHTALFVSISVTCAVSSSLMTITVITLVFHNSHFLATFLLLFVIGLASAAFALAGSAFFSSERQAVLIVFLIYGGTAFIIEVFVFYPEQQLTWQ
ncbi:hypothetical protein FOZ63_001881, partial [Perkinsus olseni]